MSRCATVILNKKYVDSRKGHMRLKLFYLKLNCGSPIVKFFSVGNACSAHNLRNIKIHNTYLTFDLPLS